MLSTLASYNTARDYNATHGGLTAPKPSPSARPPAVAINIETRFEQFLLQPDTPSSMVRLRPGEVRFEDSEQSYARRHLLEVEKVALGNKQRSEQSNASLTTIINDNLHQTVVAHVCEQLTRPDVIFSRSIGCSATISALFKTLYSSIGARARLESLISLMPWLEAELIRHVNAPAFRRMNNKGNLKTVTSLRTALGYLGMDNLVFLIPILLCNYVKPGMHKNFTLIPKQHRIYTAASIKTARSLAAHCGHCYNSAALLVMLSGIARAIICQLFFSAFKDAHQALTLQNRQDGRFTYLKALHQITPSCVHLTNLLQAHSMPLTASLAGALSVAPVDIHTPANALVNKHEASHPLATIVIQSLHYNQVRMLLNAGILSKDVAKIALRSMQYPAGSLEILRSRRIF